MKHSKVKQADLDKFPSAVLFQDRTPEPPEKKIVRKQRFEDCPECEQPDLSFEGILDNYRIYVCYNCGYERQENTNTNVT